MNVPEQKRSVQIRTITGHVADGGGWDPDIRGGESTHDVELDHPAVEDAIAAAINVLYQYGCTEWVDYPWPYRAEPSTREYSSYCEERMARLCGFSPAEESRLRAALRGKDY